MTGIEIRTIEKVGSTNSYLKAIKNPWHGLVVLARSQESGRGLGENKWESIPGENITGSIHIKPRNITPMNSYRISMIVSVGVAQFIDTLYPGSQIKWPNDIYIGDKKIAGILIENEILGTRISRSVVGVGLNVNQIAFSIAPNPTSLKLLTNNTFQLKNIAEGLFSSILSFFELDRKNEINIEELYHNRLFRLNKSALFRDEKGEFEGVIKHVATDGQISITDSDNMTRKYYFKEVQFVI